MENGYEMDRCCRRGVADDRGRELYMTKVKRRLHGCAAWSAPSHYVTRRRGSNIFSRDHTGEHHDHHDQRTNTLRPSKAV
jgi:hypothetical protein